MVSRTKLKQAHIPAAERDPACSQAHQLTRNGALPRRRASLKAPLSHLSLEANALSRRRLSWRVCSSCQSTPLLTPDLVGAAYSPELGYLCYQNQGGASGLKSNLEMVLMNCSFSESLTRQTPSDFIIQLCLRWWDMHSAMITIGVSFSLT